VQPVGRRLRGRSDDDRIKSHLDRVVRGIVEETLNALLDAEADRLCNAQRYERSAARRDTRAGQAGEVRNVPLLVAIGVTRRIRRAGARSSSISRNADTVSGTLI